MNRSSLTPEPELLATGGDANGVAGREAERPTPGRKTSARVPRSSYGGQAGVGGDHPAEAPRPFLPFPFSFSAPPSRSRSRAARPAAARPGPARFPPTAGARPRGPALELCREEKLGGASGGRESEARGGAGRGGRRSRARGARRSGGREGPGGRAGGRGAAGAPRGAAAGCRPPGEAARACCGAAGPWAAAFARLRACFPFLSSPRRLAPARGGAGDGDAGAEALPPPARPAVSRGGRVLPDPSSGRTEAEGRRGREVCVTAG